MTAERTFTAPELIKNKYYKATEVNALLKNCGEVLEALQKENKRLYRENNQLKKEADALTTQKNQVSDTLTSSKIIAREIVSEANRTAKKKIEEAETEANEIVEEAKERAEQIKAAARREGQLLGRTCPELYNDENMLKNMGECIERLKKQQLDLVKKMEEEWQSILLYSGKGNTLQKEEDDLPSDLSEKLSAIASQLRSFEIQEDDEE